MERALGNVVCICNQTIINRTITYKEGGAWWIYWYRKATLIEYCINVWSPHYTKGKELSEKVQRRFTKCSQD